MLLLIGLLARTIDWRESTPVDADRPLDPAHGRSSSQTQFQSNEEDTNRDLAAVANQLFSSINPSLPQNQYFPDFAKEKIAWITRQQKAGKLSIIFLKNIENTNLDFESLMAAGIAEGKPVIVIARPRFLGFLIEGGRMSAPFTQQQRNDFALGLVHEAVHLQNPDPGDPASLDSRLHEEFRAWREVSVNVVRPLRTLNQPMNYRLVQADDALRSCEDKLPCEPLTEILLPGERRRSAIRPES